VVSAWTSPPMRTFGVWIELSCNVEGIPKCRANHKRRGIES